jgi:hypothetical protein
MGGRRESTSSAQRYSPTAQLSIEYVIAGVVCAGEGDAGATMTAGAAQVQRDPIGRSRKPFGRGRFGYHLTDGLQFQG